MLACGSSTWIRLIRRPPVSVRYPRSEPDCMTRLVSEHDQPHIRSPRETAAPISRLRRSGLREDETILEDGLFRPCSDAVRPPGSARTDQVLEDLRIRSAFIVRYVSSRLPR